jgi:hypothetical protein
MSKRRTIVVTASATTTSDWFNLDYRYGEAEDRSFFCTFASVSNQTLELQVGAWDDDNRDSVAPDHIYSVSTYTNLSSTDGVLTGNWPAVRVILGVNGAAKFVLLG